MIKKTTMKIGNLDFLSLPWRLCRKRGGEKLCRFGGDLQNSEQLLWLVLGTQDSHKIV